MFFLAMTIWNDTLTTVATKDFSTTQLFFRNMEELKIVLGHQTKLRQIMLEKPSSTTVVTFTPDFVINYIGKFIYEPEMA